MNAIKILFLTIFVCLSQFISLSAQERNITIKGKLNSADMKKYAYLELSSSLQREKIDDGGNFLFQSKADFTDTMLTTRITVSDKLYQTSDDITNDVRNGNLKSNNDFFRFTIDTTEIHIDLHPAKRWIDIIGGRENSAEMEFAEIIAVRNQDYNQSKNLDSINREADRKSIAVAVRYNDAITSVGKLTSIISSLNRDTSLKTDLLQAIDNLDESVLGYRKKKTKDLYLSTLHRISPKSNELFPKESILSDSKSALINLGEEYKNRKYVLIDFWATWCAPCIQQHPQIAALADKFKDHPDIAIVGISVDKKKPDWLNYLQNKPFKYPNYWLLEKDHKNLVDSLGIISIPRYMLLRTKDNILVEMNLKVGDLEKTIKKYIN